MITKERVKCKCHELLARSENVGTRAFPQKKYYCRITGKQLFNDFIHEKSKVNLRDPDDTLDGSEVKCPEDLEKAYEDYDYKKKQGGDD